MLAVVVAVLVSLLLPVLAFLVELALLLVAVVVLGRRIVVEATCGDRIFRATVAGFRESRRARDRLADAIERGQPLSTAVWAPGASRRPPKDAPRL